MITSRFAIAAAFGAMAAVGLSASPARAADVTTSAMAAAEPVSFDVFLSLNNEAALDALLAAQQDPNSRLRRPDRPRRSSPRPTRRA